MSEDRPTNGPEAADNWNQEAAEQQFENFIIYLLRGPVNGDNAFQVSDDLHSFLRHSNETKVSTKPAIKNAITSLSQKAFGQVGASEPEIKRIAIIRAGLRVLIEKMSRDNAASGRLSQRWRDFMAAVDEKIIGSETRARANGRSYVDELIGHLGKWTKRK